MNNNLIIFYKDKSRDVFSFAPETDEQSALEFFEGMRPDVNKNDIEKYFYITEDKASPDLYGNHAELTEEHKIKINLNNLLISKKVEEVRKKRDAILVNLDLPFMKSLEEDDPAVKNHIVSMKNFLRDLPQNLNLHGLNEEEIIKYNPFGNIFDIVIIHSPVDYTKPPEITIDPPKNGAQAKAMSFIKDGRISKIEITNHGNGYDFLPKVEIENSDSGETPKVMCGLPQNCFLTEAKIIENTRGYYS